MGLQLPSMPPMRPQRENETDEEYEAYRISMYEDYRDMLVMLQGRQSVNLKYGLLIAVLCIAFGVLVCAFLAAVGLG